MAANHIRMLLDASLDTMTLRNEARLAAVKLESSADRCLPSHSRVGERYRTGKRASQPCATREGPLHEQPHRDDNPQIHGQPRGLRETPSQESLPRGSIQQTMQQINASPTKTHATFATQRIFFPEAQIVALRTTLRNVLSAQVEQL